MSIVFSEEPARALCDVVAGGGYDLLVMLTDDNVLPHALALQKDLPQRVTMIVNEPGEEHKNLDVLKILWNNLMRVGATRHSLLINVGGGVITDIGGLAAATFKRGMHFVNCPTTILAAVDAAIGGKTGVNFNEEKNMIGVFANPDCTIISTRFFSTLPLQERKSGYAEMLKHAMISSAGDFAQMISSPGDFLPSPAMLQRSVKVKTSIVEQDPNEQGLRKALNWGHTAGHAFESLALQRGTPVAHGFAVAWGMVVESVLSHMVLQFPSRHLYDLARFVREHYGVFHITCDDYPALLSFMRHDKKNRGNEIRCTLLRNPGDVEIDNTVTEDQITAALDIYRDLMGI